jgi:phosphoribosylamine-glycine ligase
VTVRDEDLEGEQTAFYAAVEKNRFAGAHFRRDITAEAMNRRSFQLLQLKR